MESLSTVLQPYKDRVGQVATIVTIGQFFSGVFICKDIYKNGSTKGISATPFVGGIAIGILMLKYGLMLEDTAMIQVNVAAIVLNIAYVLFYYKYCEKKWDDVLQPMTYATALVVAFLSYIYVEDVEKIEYRYGLLVTILMLLLLAAPLKDLKEILQKKDASSIPFPLTFMGTIVSFLWLLYGIILLNNFMIVQNFIGMVLCLSQLILVYYYPKRGQSIPKKKNVKKE